MSDTFKRILELAANGEIRISAHGYDEIAQDNLSARELLAGIQDALIIEDYASYHKGPCVLTLQRDRNGGPVHVVWGIPKGQSTPAVLITAYRPDPARWTADFMRRK